MSCLFMSQTNRFTCQGFWLLEEREGQCSGPQPRDRMFKKNVKSYGRKNVRKNVRQNARRYARMNVRKSVRRYAKICQKGCQKICQKDCRTEGQEICQKECQKCQKACLKECHKICQKECQKICQKECRRYVRKNVRRYVRKNVGQNTRRYARKNVRRNVRENVWKNVRRYVRKNVRRDARNNVRKNVWRSTGMLEHVWWAVHKLLTLLQVVYCQFWFLFTQLCLTGGILTCFGVFGVRQCFGWCYVCVLSAQTLLTGGLLACFGRFDFRKCCRWSTAMLMSCLLKHICQVVYWHVSARLLSENVQVVHANVCVLFAQTLLTGSLLSSRQDTTRSCNIPEKKDGGFACFEMPIHVLTWRAYCQRCCLDMSERLSEDVRRYVRKNVIQNARRYARRNVRKNVRRYVKKNVRQMSEKERQRHGAPVTCALNTKKFLTWADSMCLDLFGLWWFQG